MTSYIKEIETIESTDLLKIERDLLFRIYRNSYRTGREVSLEKALIMTLEELDRAIEN